MTHQEILNKTKAEIDSLCAQAKEKLDAIAPKTLEVGKWYRFNKTGLFCYQGEGDMNYGFNTHGQWSKSLGSMLNEGEATPQEVEKALIKEARRRYKVGDKIFLEGENRILDMNTIQYLPKSNSLFISLTNKGQSGRVFEKGKWETIIEQDKFAELKEARRHGAKIQVKCELSGGWGDLPDNYQISWKAEEYRIKPEEKPKVGDVCKFWDNDESQFVVSVLIDITECYFTPYVATEYCEFINAKTLNQQEAIELLFNNK